MSEFKCGGCGVVIAMTRDIPPPSCARCGRRGGWRSASIRDRLAAGEFDVTPLRAFQRNVMQSLPHGSPLMTKAEALVLIDAHKNSLIDPVEMLRWTYLRVVVLMIEDRAWDIAVLRAVEEVLSR